MTNAHQMTATSSPSRIFPRRRPAHQSVSLKQPYKPSSALQREYNGEEKSASNSGSSTTPNLLGQESSGETSNADRWFAKHNKNPKMHHTSPNDQDPPFRPDISSPSANGLPYTHVMHHPAPPILDTYASSSEEYRGVIDDLTIQIKKLQKKLKKHEKSQDSQLDMDKRVEIKTFGIPVDKKRELEAFLSKFTASLDEPSSNHAVSSSAFASAAMTNSSTRVPGTTMLKPSESNSTTIFADSGYGSLTYTGKRSSTMSNATMRPSQPQQAAAAAAQAKDAQIASFLQDIPSGLLPHPAVDITEKARKKLVVMRLEQVLGGRGAGPGVHHQSLQQQEVSQSAATAERSALEAMGRRTAPEGVREATIMPDSDDQDMLAIGEQVEALQGIFKGDHVVERDFAAGAAVQPEQRPTRPLDLDPDRAQSAAENAQYLRHLGFSLQDNNMLQAKSDEEGWVYLNLMIGLAQLHSFNVTTDFVREAVAKYSKTFELSDDGRKVRVRPAGSRSKSSNDESPSSWDQAAQQPRKRSFAAMVGVEPKAKTGRHLHTPLFPPKEESLSNEESGSITAESTIPQTGFDGETANLRGSGMLGAGRKKKDDEPMIFYQRAKFYTDLSADPAFSVMSLQHGYQQKNPLGERPVAVVRRDSIQPRYRPLVDGIIPKEVEPVDESAVMDLNFSETSPRRVAFVEDNSETLFQVSGLHGIYPEDHFSITVAQQHNLSSPQFPPTTRITSKSRSYPNRLFPERTSPLKSSRSQPRTLTTKRTMLPPSELPEPSYGLDEEELDSDEEEEDDHQSEPSGTIPSTMDLPRLAATSAFGNAHKRARHTYGSPSDASDATSSAGQAASSSSPSAASSSAGYSDVNMEDDDHRGHSARNDAIDFLAHARTVDPDAIRAMEREYDAHVAERLAEEIPAGSSAATAGGGSGWGSPVGAGESGDQEMQDGEETNDGASVRS